MTVTPVVISGSGENIMREATQKENEKMTPPRLNEKRVANMLRQRVRRKKKKTWLSKFCKGLSPDGVIGAAMVGKCKIVWIDEISIL